MRKWRKHPLLFFKKRQWKLQAIKRRLLISGSHQNSVLIVLCLNQCRNTTDYGTFTNSSTFSNPLVKTKECRSVIRWTELNFNSRSFYWLPTKSKDLQTQVHNFLSFYSRALLESHGFINCTLEKQIHTHTRLES